MLIGETMLLMIAIIGMIMLHGFTAFSWIMIGMMIFDRYIDWMLVMVASTVTILLIAFWLCILEI